MKTLFAVLMLVVSISSFAQTIEGRLVAKLSGELDPFILGDGCLSIVEFYATKAERFVTIGIYENNEEGCFSSDVTENEEIDFDLDQISKIKNSRKVRALADLTHNVLGIDKFINFYEVK